MGPQFRETAYISEVNEAKKVKSYAQVAKNKNSDPMQKLFPWGRPGRTVPQLQFFQTSGIFRNESSHRYPRNRQQFGFSGYLWISVSKLTNNTHVTFGYSHLVKSFLYILLFYLLFFFIQKFKQETSENNILCKPTSRNLSYVQNITSQDNKKIHVTTFLFLFLPSFRRGHIF